MNFFTPSEIMENYADIGAKKAAMPAWKMLCLGIVAGMLIGVGAAVANIAAHASANASIARITAGLLFPFGLGIVILIGAELFTGNAIMCVSFLEKKTGIRGILKNCLFVYVGNFIGGLLMASCVFVGHLKYSDGGLAVYTIKIAAAKCEIPFLSAAILGIFCNILVCLGVLCSLSAKDTTGRIMGAYIPVAFFVICGFEHSVANMYFIPAGLFAKMIPEYAGKAVAAGLDTAALTWGRFIIGNLIPVTIGNMLGGMALSILLWACHKKLRA